MLETLENVRARIGLIIPSSNRLTEPQMRRYAPPGVEIHVTRLRMTGATHVPLDQLMPRIVEATLALADARCDVIVFHCTASSMEAGLEGERSRRPPQRHSPRLVLSVSSVLSWSVRMWPPRTRTKLTS
jgi:maleate isomerase